ncbi:molecular chaperone [Pseudomonas chlororaphis]|uniref:Molecular chaperone n=1 Tax=Pseudomonas chlororaphis TaxID=587753 RepID=A0AB34C9E9_9PSED|nr:molecular chaperone [Pseudomonas chlororaphis]KAA5844198.1 molecular chaperone [Pseudomonas chlororaphis]
MIKVLINTMFALVLLNPVLAVADLSLVGKSRIVFENEGGGSRVRLDISNQHARLSLASISVEWGDQRQEDIPLAVSSPLLTIPAEQQKSIELFYQGQGLPEDRESYFLLNILDVPTVPQQENALQIALRHRYKLFYRPKLEMTPDQAVYLLAWQRIPAQDSIEADNPSPYYLTITNLIRRDPQGRRCGNSIAHMVLAPFSKKTLASDNCFEPVKELQYNIVTDSGREVEQHSQVQSEIE